MILRKLISDVKMTVKVLIKLSIDEVCAFFLCLGNKVFDTVEMHERKKEKDTNQQTNKESHAHPGEVLGVSQKDGPLLSDAVAVVELHQLIQRGEELVPHVVLTTAILQHLEMLNVVPVTVR